MSKPMEWIVVFDKPEKLLGGHLPGAEDANEGIFARVHVIEKSAYDEVVNSAYSWHLKSQGYKAKAAKLAEVLENIAERSVDISDASDIARQALKEYRGEK